MKKNFEAGLLFFLNKKPIKDNSIGGPNKIEKTRIAIPGPLKLASKKIIFFVFYTSKINKTIIKPS